MRPLLILSGVVLLTLFAGALLAWPVHLLLEPFFEIPYHKIISRLTSLLGLVFIFIYLYSRHMLNLDTIGFSGLRSANIKRVYAGLLAGLFIMLVLEIILFMLGLHQWDSDKQYSLSAVVIILIKAILAGGMVGLLEETLYRGALLGGLKRQVHVYAAILFSSLLYAAVHFIKFRALPADTVITLLTGPAMLPGAFFRFTDPAIIDGFISLFAFGVLLALVRIREGNIYMCIGLHAGAVMAIKIFNELTDFVPGSPWDWLVSQHDHLLGYLATLWLCIIIVVYLVSKRTTPPAR